MTNEDDVAGFVIGAQMQVGTVVKALDPPLLMTCRDAAGESIECYVLHTSSAAPLTLRAGDSVLLWSPADQGRGVILGRIGPGRSESHVMNVDAETGAPSSSALPESITLEATDELTLRVGDGSITIRKDGKILIKGKDLVSHAQRMNRIKGGAVSIN